MTQRVTQNFVWNYSSPKKAIFQYEIENTPQLLDIPFFQTTRDTWGCWWWNQKAIRMWKIWDYYRKLTLKVGRVASFLTEKKYPSTKKRDKQWKRGEKNWEQKRKKIWNWTEKGKIIGPNVQSSLTGPLPEKNSNQINFHFSLPLSCPPIYLHYFAESQLES